MGCDMVVALGQATVEKHTLFGLNYHGLLPQDQNLKRLPGRVHAPGEIISFSGLELPQVRQTCTILGNQPLGSWGLTHGMNEHQVVAGFCSWQSKLPRSASGLGATELIRLTLERCHSALQGLDVLTDLITRFGLRAPAESAEPADPIFLVADGREAFVVEAAGRYWATLDCQQVRAVSDVALIRQDWRRLSPGLADFVIEQGWWIEDGSKLDVAANLAQTAIGLRPTALGFVPTSLTREALAENRVTWALKRWSKATLRLEHQNGRIDSPFLRKLLDQHFETTIAAHQVHVGRQKPLLLTSFLARLSAESGVLPMAWFAYGPRGNPVYLPVFLVGDLPRALEQAGSTYPSWQIYFQPFQELLDSEDDSAAQDSLEKLQQRIDQETEEFLGEARDLLAQGNKDKVFRLAGLLMQNHWELLENERRRLIISQSEPLAVHAR